MALIPTRTFAPLYGLLPVNCVFWPLFPLYNFVFITVCTQFHHLCFGRPLSRFPWRLSLNTWLIYLFIFFTIRSINMTKPIQPIHSGSVRLKTQILGFFVVFFLFILYRQMLGKYLELGQDFILSHSLQLFISRFSAMELTLLTAS